MYSHRKVYGNCLAGQIKKFTSRATPLAVVNTVDGNRVIKISTQFHTWRIAPPQGRAPWPHVIVFTWTVDGLALAARSSREWGCIVVSESAADCRLRTARVEKGDMPRDIYPRSSQIRATGATLLNYLFILVESSKLSLQKKKSPKERAKSASDIHHVISITTSPGGWPGKLARKPIPTPNTHGQQSRPLWKLLNNGRHPRECENPKVTWQSKNKAPSAMSCTPVANFLFTS